MATGDFHRERMLEACYQYVLSRQTREGGFCYYLYRPWGVEEPNAKDTYSALAILKLLGRPVPQIEACIEWLRAQQDDDGCYSTLVIGHAVLKALRIIGGKPLRDPRPFLLAITQAQGFTDPGGLVISGWVANALLAVELRREFALTIEESVRRDMHSWLESLWCQDGGFGAPATNLLDTGTAVELSLALTLPVRPQVLDYARRCEGSPWSFNLTRNSSASSLDVQRAGLKILNCFNARPVDPGGIRQFVANCQIVSGGFGRAPGAVAGLSESLTALEV